MTTTETKTRSEAPIAALVLGGVALIAGILAAAPGFALIAGLVAILAGAYTLRRGQNWMAIAGIAASALGILISILKISA